MTTYRWSLMGQDGVIVDEQDGQDALLAMAKSGQARAVRLTRAGESAPFLVVNKPKEHPEATPVMLRRRKNVALTYGQQSGDNLYATAIGWRNQDWSILFFVPQGDEAVFITGSLWGDWDAILEHIHAL